MKCVESVIDVLFPDISLINNLVPVICISTATMSLPKLARVTQLFITTNFTTTSK
jgi:hypothetical protein